MILSIYLHNLSNESFILLNQLGVSYVDLYQRVLPGYQKELHRGLQEFEFNKDEIVKVIKRVRENGLRVNSFFAPPIRKALFGEPEGEKQIDNVCKFIKLMSENSIYLVDLGLQDVRQGPIGVPGRYVKEHRGGYKMDAFSVDLMLEELEKRNMNAPWAHNFKEKLSFEDYFKNCVRTLNAILPIAEEVNVKLMSHFEDPPIDDKRLLPGFTNPLQIRMLFEKINSKNFGISFCCGTRYESGIDVFQQIRMFGEKIFFVHLRNVRGTITTTKGYEEVAIDDGDMNMLKVLKTLKEVKYEGAVNPDHLPLFLGDNNNETNKVGLAYTVGYIKALLHHLKD